MQIKVPFKIESSNLVLNVFESSFQRLKQGQPSLYLSSQITMDIRTAFVEAVVNAIQHAEEFEKNACVTGKLFLSEKEIGFDVIDHGPGFDVDAVTVPNFNHPQTSGRGIFIMKQLGDRVEYKKQKDKNVLIFKRHLLGQNGNSRELDLLYSLSEAIIREASLDDVYQIILSQALDLFHVERASVLIYDEHQNCLKVVASRGISKQVQKDVRVKPGEGISGYVFQHGRALLIEDIDKNKRGIEKKEHYKTSSFISAPMICSPLRLGERSLGVINLTDRIDGKTFTKKDLQLLSTIANQAMACLYIRDLVREVKMTEDLKKELDIVRRVQVSYLPTKAPLIKGFDLSGRCEMAQSVGGDYFDYDFISPFLYLVIADVSGHDMRSAMTMVNFRAQLKAYLHSDGTLQESHPSQILTALNQTLYDDLCRFDQFVSCVLVKINTESGQFELANAGHYPPLFFKERIPLTESGLVMGVNRQEKYRDVPGDIAADDGMILFTDGVIESMNERENFFGMDRLRQVIHQSKAKRSEEIAHSIIESVLDHRWHRQGASEKPSAFAFKRVEDAAVASKIKILDDVTVVVLKRFAE